MPHSPPSMGISPFRPIAHHLHAGLMALLGALAALIGDSALAQYRPDMLPGGVVASPPAYRAQPTRTAPPPAALPPAVPQQAQPIQPAAPVYQAQVVGTVKTLTGQAVLEWNQQRQSVYIGMPVNEGARLTTMAGSSVGITFRDETLMSIGPDTHLVIDQYLYAPHQGQVGLVTSLLRGTLNYVSGQIAKIRPESVNVRTPTGTIGVRGTQFVVRVDPT